MSYYICICKEFSNEFFNQNNEWEWSAYNKNGNERKHKNVFDSLERGDKLLCYSTSRKSFVAILEIGSNDCDSVWLKFIKNIHIPLKIIHDRYDDIFELNPSKYAAFPKKSNNGKISNAFNGTFFATTKEQFETLLSLK